MPKKLVVCMKWGGRYGPDYVNRLWRMCRRHIDGEFDFVCFTDSAQGVIAEVDCRPLPPFEGVRADLAVKPWRKLSLWQGGLGKDLEGRDALFLDLDVVVVGRLDALWDHEPGRYVVWENPTKKGGGIGNTSVFRFCVGAHPEIFDYFIADPVRLYEKEFRIEQEYISAVLGDGKVVPMDGGKKAGTEGVAGVASGAILRSGAPAPLPRPSATTKPAAGFMRWGQGEQRYWPRGWCVSFKQDLLPAWPLRFFMEPRLPKGCRVVVFHGKPDPDEAMEGRWPARGWKKLYKYVRPVGWVRENWG